MSDFMIKFELFCILGALFCIWLKLGKIEESIINGEQRRPE